MSASPHFVQAARTVTIVASGSFSDTVNLTPPTMRDDQHRTQGWCEGLRVTTAGTIKVTTWNDDDVTLHVLDGEYVPLKIKRVWATGNVSVTEVTCYWP